MKEFIKSLLETIRGIKIDIDKYVYAIVVPVGQGMAHKYVMDIEVKQWLIDQKINHTINIRKRTLTLYNKVDAVHFLLRWPL